MHAAFLDVVAVSALFLGCLRQEELCLKPEFGVHVSFAFVFAHPSGNRWDRIELGGFGVKRLDVCAVVVSCVPPGVVRRDVRQLDAHLRDVGHSGHVVRRCNCYVCVVLVWLFARGCVARPVVLDLVANGVIAVLLFPVVGKPVGVGCEAP